MGKDWVEPNPDHPRDPKTGEFVDHPGGGWARRLSEEIGQHIDPAHIDRVRAELDRFRQASEQLHQASQAAGRTVDEHNAAASDPLFHHEMTGMLEQQQPTHPGQQLFDRIQAIFPPQTHDPTRDRREDTMFALDPISGYRRYLTQLYDILGIDHNTAQTAINDYLDILRPEDLDRPKQPEDLDYGLSGVVAYLQNGQQARELLDKIQSIREATGLNYFQETGYMVEDALIDFFGE